ncbi:MAG: UDP-3-O-acyl-N-acetylglucosamine deacetylase [Pseudomonadota bacterium]
MQKTVQKSIKITGTGLHSGKSVTMIIRPAAAEFGIWFRRTDIDQGDTMIPAQFDCVTDTRLCTKLVNDSGVEISTVEHLMAAFAGTGVHNALVEVDGPEIPIMDGSAIDFVTAILRAGRVEQDAPIRAIRILKPIQVEHGDAWARLEPSDTFDIAFDIDFTAPAIGKQSGAFNMANGTFIKELSDCRTFCNRQDVEGMQAVGLALGGSLDNAIVVDHETVMNPEGFRRDDECVRHKMLDALGDLYLAGMPIMASYTGHKAGHRVTNMLLRALFAQTDAWEITECASAEQVYALPGSDLSSELTL